MIDPRTIYTPATAGKALSMTPNAVRAMLPACQVSARVWRAPGAAILAPLGHPDYHAPAMATHPQSGALPQPADSDKDGSLPRLRGPQSTGVRRLKVRDVA